jgi:hypothetical protein
VKRNRRGESTGAVVHTCIGTTHGNSLCNYLYLKLVKCHASSFIFYTFSSTESDNKRAEQVLGKEGCWHQWEEEVAGKRVGG